MSERKQYCTFWLNGHLFGVPVLNVQEVVKSQKLTAVPMAPKMIRGLINLRGEIVPALDLRLRLEIPEAGEDIRPTNVIVKQEEGATSLLVDDIADVVELDEGDMEAPPDTLKGISHEVISGVFQLQEQILIILDPDQILHWEH